MPSVTCTKCGAVLKTAKPLAPGKKVNCPKCSKAFVVEDEKEKEEEPDVVAVPVEDEDEKDEEESEAVAVPVEDESVDQKPDKQQSKSPKSEAKDAREEAPAAKPKKPASKPAAKGGKGRKSDEPAKKGSAGVLVGVLAGVLVVSCIGCSCTGFFLRGMITGWLGWSDVAKDLAGNPGPREKGSEKTTPVVAKDKDQGIDKDKTVKQDAPWATVGDEKLARSE